MLPGVRDCTAALDFNPSTYPRTVVIYIVNTCEGEFRPLEDLRLKKESHQFNRRHHWHPRQCLRRYPCQHLPQRRWHQMQGLNAPVTLFHLAV